MLNMNPDYFTIEQLNQAGMWPQLHSSAYGIIPYIKRMRGDLIGVEIGVLKGESSYTILENCPNIKEMYGIDFYQKHVEFGTEKTKDDVEQYEKIASANLQRFNEKYHLIKMDSKDAVDKLPDEIDFLILDGDKSSEGILSDLNLYFSKVKNSGYIFICDSHIPEILQTIKMFQKERRIRTPLNISKNNVSFFTKNSSNSFITTNNTTTTEKIPDRKKSKMEKVYDLINDNGLSSLLDIGANHGAFSYQVKSHFGKLDLYMIEANDKCKPMLDMTNIPYTISCLSDTEKEIDFFLENTNDIGTGASYYIEKTEFYSKKRSVKVKTSTLDSLIEDTFGSEKSFDIIKLDTQGSELDILKGGKKLAQRAKFIIIETSLIEYNENSPLQEDVFNYMKSIGFEPKEKIEDHYHQGKVIQEDWIFENKNI